MRSYVAELGGPKRNRHGFQKVLGGDPGKERVLWLILRGGRVSTTEKSDDLSFSPGSGDSHISPHTTIFQMSPFKIIKKRLDVPGIFLLKIYSNKKFEKNLLQIFLHDRRNASDLLIDPDMNDLFYRIGGHVA